jgi:uncharacterized membrane-anchored protein YhcB (DUF1043 family)
VTDLLAILTSNAPAWGVTLTLVIAGLIVSAVLLYRYIVRLDSEIQKLKAELEAVKDKVDNKVSDLYDLVNSVARDVSWVKGRMEGDK